MSAHVDPESQRFGAGSAGGAAGNNSNGGAPGGGSSGGTNGSGIGSTAMDNLENELKMMKNLGSFPMQIPPLPMFQGACNISPSASTPTNPQSNQNQNDVDVDAGSTPRPQHPDSDGFSSSHHRTPPSPPPISPGRDYGGMFGAAGNGGGGGPGSNSTPAGSSSGEVEEERELELVAGPIACRPRRPCLPCSRRGGMPQVWAAPIPSTSSSRQPRRLAFRATTSTGT